MLHSEALKKGTYEVRHDDDGNAIHVYIKDGKAKVFPTLVDFVGHVYYGKKNIEHKTISEDDLFDLYESEHYDYESIFKDTNN